MKKIVQTPQVQFYSGISGTDVTARITPYPRDVQTGAKLTFADFGSSPTLTADPKVLGYEEIIGFTGLIDNGDDTATITGLTRNLLGKYPYFTPTPPGKQHGANSIIVFSNNPEQEARAAFKENDETITGVWNFPNGIIPSSRIQTVVDAPTVTPDADNNDAVNITAIAQAFTIANPIGTPKNFQKLIIRILDNGTGRAITFGNQYIAMGNALPATTVANKHIVLGFMYDSIASKWGLVGLANEV